MVFDTVTECGKRAGDQKSLRTYGPSGKAWRPRLSALRAAPGFPEARGRVTPGPGTRDRAEETATGAGRAEVRGPTKALT